MNLDYVLTDAAEADLRGIVRYTRKQCGAAQVRRYVADLEAGITRLVAREGIFKDMSALCHLGAASRQERTLGVCPEPDLRNASTRGLLATLLGH